jgi:hypothetical protein
LALLKKASQKSVSISPKVLIDFGAIDRNRKELFINGFIAFALSPTICKATMNSEKNSVSQE